MAGFFLQSNIPYLREGLDGLALDVQSIEFLSSGRNMLALDAIKFREKDINWPVLLNNIKTKYRPDTDVEVL